MVLKKFSCLDDDTRLIRHGDTVYKFKLSFTNVCGTHAQNLETADSFQKEVEEVVAAVVSILQSGRNLVRIQTEHFQVVPSQTHWKVGEKLEFQVNGKSLNSFRNTITLNFYYQGQGDSSLTSTTITTNQRSPVSTDQRRDKDLRNSQQEQDRSGAPHQGRNKTSDIAQGKRNKNTATKTAGTGSPSPEKVVKRNPAQVKATSSVNTVSSSTSGEKHVGSRQSRAHTREKTQVSRSPKTTSPGHALQDTQKTSDRSASVFSQSQKLRFSLRRKVSPSATASAHLGASPRKSARGVTQNRNTNNSSRNELPKIHNSADDGLNHSQVVRVGERQATVEGRPVRQSTSATQTSPSAVAKRTRQQLDFSHSGGAVVRPSGARTKAGHSQRTSRSRSRSAERRGRQGREELRSQDSRSRLRGRALETREIVNRSLILEERRLSSLADNSDDNSRGLTHSSRASRIQTFEQKDRHVVAAGDAQEELKLQMLASGETLNDTDQRPRTRSSSLIQIITDTVVTPIKQALRGARSVP